METNELFKYMFISAKSIQCYTVFREKLSVQNESITAYHLLNRTPYNSLLYTKENTGILPAFYLRPYHMHGLDDLS